jgi:hypothetical protein
MKSSPSFPKLLRIATFALLFLWAALSMMRLVQQSFSQAGGNDLYTYWYAGHFLREGKDFYKSFINNELPSVPVRYLDREVDSLNGVLFPGLVPAPASTAPVFFLMAPLAFLSWPVAKTAWLILNLALLGAIPFLLVRLFPKKKWLNRWEFTSFMLALIGMTSTRYAAASGQITFLILDLLLAALLLSERKPWIAGLLLGLALSKYSLAVGILILFIFIEPKARVVITAGAVQIAGIVGLMFLSGSGFQEIISEYILMAFWHAGREGIHLAAALHAEQYVLWIALILTLAVGIPLAFWRLKKAGHPVNQSLSPLSRYHFAVILILWALLVGYHRAYDAMVVIIFFGLVAYLAKQPDAWKLSRKGQTALKVFSVVALLLLMVPSGSVVRGLLPPSLEIFWGTAANLTATALISIFLILSIFLVFRVIDEKEGSASG